MSPVAEPWLRARRVAVDMSPAIHLSCGGADIRLAAHLPQPTIDQGEQRQSLCCPCARHLGRGGLIGAGELRRQAVELVDQVLKVGVVLCRPPMGGLEESADVSAQAADNVCG